jgi:signal transduction histidine kinase
MTQEEMGKVFDEFYRAKNPRTQSIPGTGLGLTLVKRLVDMHDGSIEVTSTEGIGTTFILSLPTTA